MCYRKTTNKSNKVTYRYNKVLKLIHIDIYRLFPMASWNGQKYFVSFIDDDSCYGYL